MELFVLGIDAASEEMLRAFDMPFVHNLLDSLKKKELNEDLISRGWVETYTGQHASRTKGFYEFPMIDKTYDWSISFNLNIIDKTSNLLWETLNKKDVSVGFMGVPTTYPVPKVEGFFVGGGGGGRALNSSFDDGKSCFPNEISKILDNNNYIIDERVPSLLFEKKIYEPTLFFDKLIEMMDRRTQSYIEIYKLKPVRFGFLAYRALATVAYLSMSEIQRFIDKESPLDKSYLNELKRFFAALDTNIEKIFDNINIQNVMLLSDHGMVAFDSTINFNFLLQKLGYQIKKSNTSKFRNYIYRHKDIIPYGLRQKLKKNKTLKSSVKRVLDFDVKETLAFSLSELGEVSGIFINDEIRFNGPVLEKDIQNKVAEICDSINNSPEAKRYKLHAFSSKDRFNGEKYESLIPNIIITKPLNTKSLTTTPRLYTENAWFNKPLDLKNVRHDNWTGGKKANALFFITSELEKLVLEEDKNDLTLTYKIADRFFK